MKFPIIQFLALVFILFLGFCDGSLAVEPDEVLKDFALEKRARNISSELRCLVCQNQSIDDSNAPLARDLRILVRERLTAGDSDKEAINYIVSRYGEFVLLRPRLGAKTIILWFAPMLLILAGLYGVYRSFRSRTAQSVDVEHLSLSKLEKDRIKKILGEN